MPRCSPILNCRRARCSLGAGTPCRICPQQLVDSVRNGESGQQLYADSDGNPWVGVALNLRGFDVGYVEAFPLDTTERTLRVLASALIVGAILATLVATFFGWSTSRRLLRPLSRVADAAGDIASGTLGARLDEETDPDLNRLAGSFNEMADAVQERIEREQRFASDVSHELRSPITALTAAVEVLDARRADLPDRTQQALDVVVSQIRRFDDMVIDLLELSRLEAGAHDLHAESVDLVELADRVSQRFGYGELPIEVHRRAKRRAQVDRVRFERILGNLLENATHHAGGPIRISIEPSPVKKSVLLAVEDQGPAWQPASASGSSNASPGEAPPATGSGPDWAWRSSPNTLQRSVAKRGSRTVQEAGPVSSYDCQRRTRDSARTHAVGLPIPGPPGRRPAAATRTRCLQPADRRACVAVQPCRSAG